MSTIQVIGVRKVFPNGVEAVGGVDIEIQDGEFLVLVGPSGCGKTTLLRLLAGLEDVSEGRILLHDTDITDLPSQQRDVAMVFQNYALYPHMTVAENLAFGLKLRRMEKRERQRRVTSVATALGLEDLLDRKPQVLSGGQRQRVAMGRAIVREPQAFLMDEPLSNLDAKLRVSMRAELARLHKRLNVTTVYVTHDQVEAMTLGQRVAVMRAGKVQQVDRPQSLYARPANLFVAAFIGSPAMNLVEARISGGSLQFAGFEIPLAPDRRPRVKENSVVILGIRPEDFQDATFAGPELPLIEVVADVVEELGSDTHVFFRVDAPRVNTEDSRAAVSGEDDTLLADDRATFAARVGPSTNAVAGASIKIGVNNNRFHFFDRETGANLLQLEKRHLVGVPA